MSDEIGAEVTPHFAPAPEAQIEAPQAVSPVIEVSAVALSADDDEDESAIEIVDSFEPAEHILETMLPPPLESGTRSLETLAEAIAALADASFDVEATEDDGLALEAVETERVAPLESGMAPRMSTLMPLARCGAIDEVEPTSAPQAHDDYATLVRVLVDVAVDAGSVGAADALPPMLEADAVARAWRAILRGESDDFAACGAFTLDEWAADVLARFIASPGKASLFRRELRARGIAAFGIISIAA